MKARVKATGEIVDVDFDKDALANDYPPYRTNEIPSRFFLAEQLEWVDIKEKVELDYWEKLEHQYAGMAMQGILSNSEYLRSLMHTKHDDYRVHEVVPNIAVRLSHALVEKMKEEK